ncbi:sigma-70 family RNA polymerase sigma factor [Sulfuriroseicoccus oceanibius]|uniref:Sigma-70 family RNA polymerase sigma factor n=1 Tax=Sulfuriroseicoccus oceanibius TaxID=2707525 RepID=A0A6B3L115_9BACT|nr:sigma-70 family RNA polymerase sigma factor [Sulfuriroseicoccus oceanibius]QQL43675.1 sigma-70 family RNA polymerase sigma factor [Sulfuriroseicoccus oceanibius]
MDDTNHDESSDFVQLLTAHQGDLWAYVMALMPGESEAKDVVQRVNVVLWRKREEFELGTNFKAWAFAVARFEVLAYLKTKKRRRWLMFSDELQEMIAEEFVDEPETSEERMMYLQACMAKLRKPDQELIKHRYYSREGLSVYAERVGKTESALSVKLFRLRAALRKCVEKQESMVNGGGL